MTKKIIAIWAQAEDGLIGKDKVMPWHLPAELQHFKATTTGHAILMGRVTFDGLQRRVLPNRISLILSKDKNYQVDNENVLLFSDVEDVLDWYHKQDRNLYIIGGAQIIRAFEPYLEEFRLRLLLNLKEIPISLRHLTGLLIRKLAVNFMPKMKRILMISL